MWRDLRRFGRDNLLSTGSGEEELDPVVLGRRERGVDDRDGGARSESRRQESSAEVVVKQRSDVGNRVKEALRTDGEFLAEDVSLETDPNRNRIA